MRKLTLGILFQWQLLFYCIIQSWHLIFNASVSWVGYYECTLGRWQCQLLGFCHFTPNLPFSILLCGDIAETFQTTFSRILCLLGLVGSNPAHLLPPTPPPHPKWEVRRKGFLFCFLVIPVSKVHRILFWAPASFGILLICLLRGTWSSQVSLL